MSQKTDQSVPSEILAEALDPLRILAQLPLRPYQRLGDFRCGKGALTIPLAKYVFDGKVYATDELVSSREELEKNLEDTHLSNTVVYDQKEEDATVEAESLDGALVALALSATKTSKPAFLKRVAKLMKRGAWVAIVEWAKIESYEGPVLDKRMDDAEVVDIAQQAGFRFTEKRNLSSDYYLVILRK
jgi:cyclopropane fatty-acyl-phospholipid synthase-like methyltransferase